MTVTVMKTFFQRFYPKIVNYRDYKGFHNDLLRIDVLSKLSTLHDSCNENFFFSCFRYTFGDAPQKINMSVETIPLINKTILRNIIPRNRVRNRY